MSSTLNRITPTSSTTASSSEGQQLEEDQNGQPSKGLQTGKQFSGWTRIVPFFLSGVLFLSFFFTVFAPLPILMVSLRRNRIWALAAAVANSLFVWFLSSTASLAIYLVFVVVLGLTMAEMLKKKTQLTKVVATTLISMALSGALFVAFYAQIHHLNPILELKTQITTFVDLLVQNLPMTVGMMNPADVDDWKRSLLVEFPSAIAIFSLVLVWSSLVLVLRVNPNGVRENLGLDAEFFRKWKAPEVLVWPTIASGFFLVVPFGLASDIAVNIFKFIMAIYAIQGLSILSFFFDQWNIRSFLRWVGFSVALFLMMPLVLSLGFFDLWFDFRGKLRQS